MKARFKAEHDQGRRCSFCGVSAVRERLDIFGQSPPRQLLVTTTEHKAWICEVCLKDCGAILSEHVAELQGKPADSATPPPPVDTHEFLDHLSQVTRALDDLRQADPEAARAKEPERSCSMCSRTRAGKVVTGPHVAICEGCVVAATYVWDRQLLRRRYGEVYDELVALLFRLDPVGLNFEENTDEYSPEARALLPRFGSCSTVDDVANLLHDVFVQFFDAKIAGPREVYERISPEVWNLWQTRGQPR